MQTEEFLAAVERRASLTSEADARAVTAAVLETLGQRITRGEAEDIASQLPAELEGDLVASVGEEAEEFSVEEFVERVEAREAPQGVTGSTTDHIRAVITALGDAVSGGELEDTRDQLPAEFEQLFEPLDLSEGQR